MKLISLPSLNYALVLVLLNHMFPTLRRENKLTSKLHSALMDSSLMTNIHMYQFELQWLLLSRSVGCACIYFIVE